MTYQTHFQKVKSLTKSGQFSEAHSYTDSLISSDETKAWGHDLKAFVFTREGNYGDALEEHTRQINTSPDEPVSYFARAELLTKLGKYDLLIADMKVAIDLGYQNDWHYYTDECRKYLAFGYLRFGDPKLALDICDSIEDTGVSWIGGELRGKESIAQEAASSLKNKE